VQSNLSAEIWRIRGFKCGSPLLWFGGDRFRPLIVQPWAQNRLVCPCWPPYESPQRQRTEQRAFDKAQPEQQTTLKCPRLNARSASKLTWADHLLVLMDTINVKRNNKGKRRKRKNEGINRRKDTLIKKAYELGEFDSIDVALIICKHGRYTMYRSRDHKT